MPLLLELNEAPNVFLIQHRLPSKHSFTLHFILKFKSQISFIEKQILLKATGCRFATAAAVPRWARHSRPWSCHSAAAGYATCSQANRHTNITAENSKSPFCACSLLPGPVLPIQLFNLIFAPFTFSTVFEYHCIVDFYDTLCLLCVH